MKRSKRWIPIVTLLAAAGPLTAQVHIEVCLDGTQVIPPVVTGGSGQASMQVDQVTNVVTLSGSYTNLSSDVVSADLILGEVDINGSLVFVPITTTGGTSGTFTGQASLSPAAVGHIYWGRSYIVLRTANHPDGELRGQAAQRMSIDCPPAIFTDPRVSDISGNPDYGPKIGHAVEAFNVSLDCTGAAAPGPYVIVIRSGKSSPTPTTRGYLWITGARYGVALGAHLQDVVRYAPTDVVVPHDLSLVGVQYMVQGYCGGRLSNGLLQVVGIGQ